MDYRDAEASHGAAIPLVRMMASLGDQYAKKDMGSTQGRPVLFEQIA